MMFSSLQAFSCYIVTLFFLLFSMCTCAEDEGRYVDFSQLKVPISSHLGLSFPGKNDNYYSFISAAGIGVVRISVAWKHIEPKKGYYKWEGLDRRILGLQKLGIDPFLTFESNLNWATRKNTHQVGNSTPKDILHWREFVLAVVERYDADGVNDFSGIQKPIKYYQVANEWISPLNRSGGWAGSTAELITYINTSYDAVKEASKDAFFVLGGLAAFNLDVMLLSEGRASFPVQQRWSETSSTEVTVAESKKNQIREIVTNHIRAVFSGVKYDMVDAHLYGPINRDNLRMNLVATEAGLNISDVLSSECGGPSLDYKDQYELSDHFYAVVDRNLNLLNQGAEFCLWFGLGEEMDTTWGNRKVPLFDKNKKPKPGYWAYKYLAFLIDGADDLRVNNVGINGVKIYRILPQKNGMQKKKAIYISWQEKQADLIKLAGGYPLDILCITDVIKGEGKLWRGISSPISCASGILAISRSLPNMSI